MLIDDLRARDWSKHPWEARWKTGLPKKFDDSIKFKLAPDIQGSLFKALELLEREKDKLVRKLKLPYDLMWIEGNIKDIKSDGQPSIPYGCLVEKEDNETLIIWPFLGSQSKAGFYLVLHQDTALTDAHAATETSVTEGEKFDNLQDTAINFTLSVLILLNCPTNLHLQEIPKPPEKLQKARIKRGKRPLYEHKILDLRLSPNQQRICEGTGLQKWQVRAHLVRGHWKIRKTGIFWWSPFARGSIKEGLITKDYNLLEAAI